MTKREQQQIFEFFAQPDAQGISNLEKAETRQKVIRRIATTDQNKNRLRALDVSKIRSW